MKQIYQRICRSNTIKNGVWLYILQFFNTVFPLITLPYVTRILGTDNYGIFSYALNIITYLQVIVEYGFNLSGARKIAIFEDEKEREKIYSHIITSKLFLLVCSFLISLILIVIFKFTDKQIYTMLIMLLIVIGTAITQPWLFQGKQKMKFVTISNAIVRIIFVILIFFLVKEENDLYMYSFLYSIVFVFIGLLQIYIIKKIFKYKYKICTLKECICELKDGWYTFTTSAMSKIFTGLGVTLLGIIYRENTAIVGIYSAIQKIPLAINMAYSPISQAVFPYISKRYKENYHFAINFIRKLIILTIILMIVSVIITSIFSYDIVKIAFGEEYTQYHLILIPLIIWAFLGILNNILGIQILVAQGKNKQYSKAFSIGSVSIVILNVILGIPFGIYGIAIATMLSELVLNIMLIKVIFVDNKNREEEK